MMESFRNSCVRSLIQKYSAPASSRRSARDGGQVDAYADDVEQLVALHDAAPTVVGITRLS